MPPGISTVARPSDSCRLADGLFRGCADVDRDIVAGLDIGGGDMAPVMGDLGDPAIDDRCVTARQIGPGIGRNVVTIGEDRQPLPRLKLAPTWPVLHSGAAVCGMGRS